MQSNTHILGLNSNEIKKIYLCRLDSNINESYQQVKKVHIAIFQLQHIQDESELFSLIFKSLN